MVEVVFHGDDVYYIVYMSLVFVIG